MSSASKTTDHKKIRKWAEERGGVPATVKRTKSDGEPGLLRIDFPEASQPPEFEHIDWDDFFEKFDESNLAFLYQEKTADGKISRFNKFVHRDESE